MEAFSPMPAPAAAHTLIRVDDFPDAILPTTGHGDSGHARRRYSLIFMPPPSMLIRRDERCLPWSERMIANAGNRNILGS
ncbi:hypothetical protein AVEN_233271-1 [Araneus ventricosus]|uniref:Uncharacterized protein n=1 Tax=Araneus ventricosus TaxID=182803 RepID=A0A4Y2TVZ9_ARAVE|nr:hypothetical protein AVEN_233271-1 [Araneus ventricosus]